MAEQGQLFAQLMEAEVVQTFLRAKQGKGLSHSPLYCTIIYLSINGAVATKYHPLCKVIKYTSPLPNTCPVVFVERDLRWLGVGVKDEKLVVESRFLAEEEANIKGYSVLQSIYCYWFLQCSAKHLLLSVS